MIVLIIKMLYVNYRGENNFGTLTKSRVPKELKDRAKMTRQTFSNLVYEHFQLLCYIRKIKG